MPVDDAMPQDVFIRARPKPTEEGFYRIACGARDLRDNYCPGFLGHAKPVVAGDVSDEELAHAILWNEADVAEQQLVYEITDETGLHWLAVHPQSGYAAIGNGYRIIETQRNRDGSPRLSPSGRAVGRRPTGNNALTHDLYRVPPASAFPADAGVVNVPVHGNEAVARDEPHYDRRYDKEIAGEKVVLPAAIRCPICKRMNWVVPPAVLPHE